MLAKIWAYEDTDLRFVVRVSAPRGRYRLVELFPQAEEINQQVDMTYLFMRALGGSPPDAAIINQTWHNELKSSIVTPNPVVDSWYPVLAACYSW